MKVIKLILHYWFAFISILSFIAGWGMLAHSLKPIQAAQGSTASAITLPALPPIEAFGSGSGSGVNFGVAGNQPVSGSPRLRTGGS
jgi:hypothetical protein